MKTIAIWSVLIFTISCVALYAAGGIPSGNESSDTEVEINSNSIHEIKIKYQKLTEIWVVDKETLGNSYTSSINR